MSCMASHIPKSGIYTKTGDSGQTSLFNGERRCKRELAFECLGSIDELNSHVGLARELCTREGNGLDNFLEWVQSRLMDLGSHCATPRNTSSSNQIQITKFPEDALVNLEEQIDHLDFQLPRLTSYVPTSV
eukprot:TRINITY_DN9475_c0_g1_i5.p1 TRINITY_DN9475_c0_g1~~TRINITY_DN9475_c0_g1_i5.p1  ORF type:complete len:131 (-),score=21.15 TRINITY_DN9475_c0_g1_i5:416-808(-)